MSLRSKIILILVAVVLCYAAADNGLVRYSAARSFGTWELQGAEEDLARVEKRIDEELEDLQGKARGYVLNEALSRFVAGVDTHFVSENLSPAAMKSLDVDLLYVVDAHGKVLWGDIRDPGSREPIRVAEFPREALSPGHPALVFKGDEVALSGVFMTSRYPLLVSTLPVGAPGDEGGERLAERGANLRGPIHGAILLGRFLGPELSQRIAGEELELSGHDGPGAAQSIELVDRGLGDARAGLDTAGLRVKKGDRFEPGADGLLHAYREITDRRTGSPMTLHVALARDIDARRRASVTYALVSTLASSTLILFVLLRLLQGIVLVPLSSLAGKAVEIGKRDDTTIRVHMDRKDEIGQLAGEFDRMLEKLAQSREQVVHTARQAGMSEIATGVLHNVGNVLNSVNVAANLATRKTDDLALRDLELLAGVLESHRQDLADFVGKDPRGKHLVPFMSELARALGAQKQAIQDELRALSQGIEHIAELVRAQQSFAGTKGVFELASLAEQVEAALVISSQALSAAKGVEVVREFAELPAVRVDKHKLMEILVNLIQNAIQALGERGGEGQRLTLCILRGGENVARIEVRDNGAGIARENLTRIFQHGFTTKKNGHGFGLHVSANAAVEMGAKLRGTSDGPGRGACFTLDIPLQEEPALAAA